MARTTQLVLPLRSRPGVLAQVCRVLAEVHVNIVALCAPEATGRTRLRLVVDDTKRATKALKAAGYRVGTEPATLVRLQNKPGALLSVTAKLAKRRKNVRSCYATTSGTGRSTVVLTLS